LPVTWSNTATMNGTLTHVYPASVLLWDGCSHTLADTPTSWEAAYNAYKTVNAPHACMPLSSGGAEAYPATRIKAVARTILLPRSVRGGRQTWVVSRSVPPHALARFADDYTVDTHTPLESDVVPAMDAVVHAAALAGCVSIRGVCGTRHAAAVHRLAQEHDNSVVYVTV